LSEYKGLLNEPVTPVSRILDTPEKNEEFDKLIDQKLTLLFEHFTIQRKEENAHVKLALALAKAHVPGFQPPKKKPGRPAKDQEEIVNFLMAVDLLTIKEGLSKRASVQKLLNQECFTGEFNKWWKVYQQAKNGEKLNGAYAALMQIFENTRNGIEDDKYISALEFGLGKEFIKKLAN